MGGLAWSVRLCRKENAYGFSYFIFFSFFFFSWESVFLVLIVVMNDKEILQITTKQGSLSSIGNINLYEKWHCWLYEKSHYHLMFVGLLVTCDFFHVFNFPGNFLPFFPYQFSRTETSWLYVTVWDPWQIDKAVDFRLLIGL